MSLFDIFSRPKISRLKAKADIQGMIQALGYQKDYEIQEQAYQALIELGSDAVEPLVAVLEDRERPMPVRGQAIRALGEIGDQRAQWPVTSMLRDGDWAMRQAAAEALGTLGDKYSVESLLSALQHRRFFTDKAIQNMMDSGDLLTADLANSALAVQEGGVQIAVVETLERIGDPRAVDTLRSLQQALQVYTRLKESGPSHDSLFGDSVRKVERDLVSAVERALETLTSHGNGATSEVQ